MFVTETSIAVRPVSEHAECLDGMMWGRGQNASSAWFRFNHVTCRLRPSPLRSERAKLVCELLLGVLPASFSEHVAAEARRT